MFSLHEEPFKIADLIEDATFIFEHQCKQKGIYLRINCADELRQADFNSDIGRIKQILMNLVSNAYKFTYQGGITLDIARQSFVQDFERHRCLRISVTDTGVGISEADSKQLFQMFGAVSKHRSKLNIKGTGLGLTITQKLVTMLGGEIKLDSEEGFGTTVTFTIKENKQGNPDQLNEGTLVFWVSSRIKLVFKYWNHINSM
mmetsp:Transcript_25751/g.29653  ORF Transcript_25751/g.29653 Transcript_25751/m.29653 type:complete len:202 (-) Transcript_25751:319-924(-)